MFEENYCGIVALLKSFRTDTITVLNTQRVSRRNPRIGVFRVRLWAVRSDGVGANGQLKGRNTPQR